MCVGNTTVSDLILFPLLNEKILFLESQRHQEKRSLSLPLSFGVNWPLIQGNEHTQSFYDIMMQMKTLHVSTNFVDLFSNFHTYRAM